MSNVWFYFQIGNDEIELGSVITSPPPPYNEALESVNEEPPTYNETITQIREKLPKLSRSISVSAHKFGRQMSVKRVATITEQGWLNESLSK